MITIENDIYSGRPNPQWQLTAAEAVDFIAALVADLTVVRPLLSIGPVLGPRGYIVRLSGLDATTLGMLGVPAIFRITEEPLDLTYLEIPLGPISAGDSEDVTDAGEEEPVDQGGIQTVAYTTPALSTCSLAYTSWNDFTFWNGSRQPLNNCYCYAANYASNKRFSIPGWKGGSPLPGGSTYASRPTDAQFTNSMQADGWKTSCSGTSLRVMAYLGKITYDSGYVTWDMHFYRKNLNGTTPRWCHKPGGGPATNKDYSGNYIPDPTTADRKKYFSSQGATYDYNQLIGTFFSPPGSRSVVVDGYNP